MLEINTSVLKNTVTFSVDRNSMKTALDAFDQIQQKAKGIKDPTINMKRFSQGLKSAERELDKLNKKASKPRSNDEREKARAAKAALRVEQQAAKEAQRTAVRRERAELKLLDVASSFKSMQHLTTAQEERSEIVQRARLGGVDYNALQAQSQYATANGIDSGMGIQGQRKLLDNYKDIQDRIGQTLNEAKFDKKSGQWKGGDQGILSAVNTAGFKMDDLRQYQTNPMGFVSALTNTLEKQGKSPEQILASLEQLGDDLGLYHKAFMNGGKALTDQVDVLKRNGQWLTEEQQNQLVAYRKFNQEMDILNDSQKLAFFEGFMESLDPATVKEWKEAMQEALPFFKGLGKAAGDVVDGLMKMTNWITGKLNLLNGDNTTKEAVSQHYGTTSAPVQPGSNPVANAYGASQPKADGTHEHNVFDTMREWWNGTSNAKDVSSYAQSTNGDYSPVSMLKQSATATATPPGNNTVVQPVVLQNNLPEGMISLTIAPDPTFGNMLNASVDQRINQNNQRMVLAVSSGQSSTGG